MHVVPALVASNLLFSYGGESLLEGIDLKVEPGARVGIIGRNGSGKSTLLQLFAGRLEPNRGTIQRPPGSTLAFQTQELDAPPERTVIEEMHAVFEDDKARQGRLREIEARIAEGGAERDRWLKEYDGLSQEQQARGFFDIDRRIETTLLHLGIDEAMWERRIGEFSGGERNIVGLARVLLAEPDLMLLDEPSNHLDMEGDRVVHRLPAQARKTAFVMVSHNRHLLDATVDQRDLGAGGASA